MADVEIKIEGLKELEKALLALPDKIAKRILARSVYAGAAVVRKAAREKCPVKTGKLRKSIKIKKRRSKDRREVVYSVFVGEFYGRMVEYGTQSHRIKAKKGKVMGKDGRFGSEVDHPGGSAKPFLRPAFDSSTHQIIEAMKAKMAEGIAKENLK
jgi:HK97 gp10 family phage protein